MPAGSNRCGDGAVAATVAMGGSVAPAVVVMLVSIMAVVVACC